MSDKLRFGICGLGFMGQSHFARLRAQPDAEVVAVCDGDEQRRRGAWGGTLGNLDLKLDLDQTPDGQVSLEGITAYARPEELVGDPRVDVVLITLPTPLHARVAVAAVESGKHVLTEKPMAYSASTVTR